MNDCITTTKQSTTKPCAYFLGYTVHTVSYKFRIILLRRSFGFVLLIAEFAMVIYNIIFLNLISILFHWYVPTFVCLVKTKKISSGQDAYACGRFTPRFCKTASCPKFFITMALNTLNQYRGVTWNYRDRMDIVLSQYTYRSGNRLEIFGNTA